jgi:hypothetical protein
LRHPLRHPLSLPMASDRKLTYKAQREVAHENPQIYDSS